MGTSCDGICSERPLVRKSGRRGVLGLTTTVWSSLDFLTGSLNLGEGSSFGVLSERERALDFCGVCMGSGSPSAPASRRTLSVNMVSIVNVERLAVGYQHISQKVQGDCALRKIDFHDGQWALTDVGVDEAGRVFNLTWQTRLCHVTSTALSLYAQNLDHTLTT